MRAYRQISIYVPAKSAEMIKKLEQIAREQDRTLGYMVLRAIEQYLKGQKK